MSKILFVALGGAIGTALRFLIGEFVKNEYPSVFPWNTLLVNLSGCLLIGFVWGYISINTQFEWLSVFLIFGILGGYTTFSSFALEGIQMLIQKSYLPFFLYLITTNIIGILLTFIGYRLSSMLAT
jgi:CrcB protein